jgi:hypothetical protein
VARDVGQFVADQLGGLVAQVVEHEVDSRFVVQARQIGLDELLEHRAPRPA